MIVLLGPWNGLGGLHFKQILFHVYEAILCKLTIGARTGRFFVTLDIFATGDSALCSCADPWQNLPKLLLTAAPRPSTGLLP